MAIQKIKLFCILDGEAAAFPVKLDADDTVGDLKNAIKEEQSPLLDDIRTSELVLFHVSIPIGIEDEDEDDKPILLDEYMKATTTKKISSKQNLQDIWHITSA
ncbi:hypothetical protein BGX21_005671 [Mortierella sp. AD011]|nr:hypothetical protein BGX20_005449 [Mortierella sp. AD010]KAF9370140.1 hypothetical protein BGX21_005671 [Mortierella sp. AD011]